MRDLLLLVEDTIFNIPVILNYYIPGFIFIKIVKISFLYDLDEKESHIIRIIISFLLVGFSGKVTSMIKLTKYSDIILYIITVSLSVIIYFILVKNDKLKNYMMKTFGYTNNSIFADCISNKTGAYIRVKLKNSNIVYQGIVNCYDHGMNPKFICIGNYIKLIEDNICENSKYYSEQHNDINMIFNEMIILIIDDLESVELITG